MKHAELLASLNKHTKTEGFVWEDSSAEHGWTCRLTIKCDDGELNFNVGFPENNEEGDVVRYSLVGDDGEALDDSEFDATEEAIAEFCVRIDQTEAAFRLFGG